MSTCVLLIIINRSYELVDPYVEVLVRTVHRRILRQNAKIYSRSSRKMRASLLALLLATATVQVRLRNLSFKTRPV